MAQWIRYSMLFPLKHEKFNSPHWSRGQRNPQGIIEHARRLGSCWCGTGVTLWTPTLMKQTKHYRLNNWSLVEKLQRYGDLKIIPIWKASARKKKSEKENFCVAGVSLFVASELHPNSGHSCVGTITLDHPRCIVVHIRGLLGPLLMSCRSTIFLMLYAWLLM